MANENHLPYDLPTALEQHVKEWLQMNQKNVQDVRHGIFPLGMVQRWIERAEVAEAALDKIKKAIGN